MWFWLGNLFLVLFLWLRVISKEKMSISRSNKQKYYFLQLKLGTCVITFFHGILSEKIIYGIILVIRVHLQGRWVISKGENKMAARYFKVKYDCSKNKARNTCNTWLSCDFDRAINFLYYSHDSRSSSRSKSQPQGQLSKIAIFIKWI